MKKMIKPKALRVGDTVGIIAPASPTTKEKVDLAVQKITALGYKVKLGESCYRNHGYLAGVDELRAEDINNMFKNKEVQAVLCLRGGYGAMKILEKLDKDIIKNNPKVFIGYSDITALHLLLNQSCNLVTFHGPMAVNIAEELDDFTMNSLLKAITQTDTLGCIENPDNIKIRCLVKGIGRGEIVGGNLSLVTATMGTPYEIDTKGKLLLLEEVGEEPYRIDCMLTQLVLAGKLQEATGIILGDWKDCEGKEYEKGLTLMEVFQGIIIPLGKPTIYNLKAGHCSPKVTLPLGVKGILNATEGKLYIEEGATV